ncbi:MAG: SH3 domain-containing protein [Hyphomicrobiaceae bacterium]
MRHHIIDKRSQSRPRPGSCEKVVSWNAGTTLFLFFLTWMALVPCLPLSPALAQDSAQRQGQSGLSVPRFASLRASRVNLRRGPGTQYPTAWVYRRAGLPVEIIKEFETWRQVRDSDGSTGWILRTLLSQRRTALVLPWEVKKDKPRPLVALHKRADSRSDIVVQVESGVIANISTCDGRWCNVIIQDFEGYILQNQLWGAYADEVIQ